MQIEQYYSQQGGEIFFSREQASRFAKQEADDYNPIHDLAAKRFCVPGDLLFAVLLSKYGVSERLTVRFTGMVADNIRLQLPESPGENTLVVADLNEKQYLTLTRSGETSQSPALVNQLLDQYVSFSGTAFPHILVPLMAENAVMINPQRPMVMYDSMSLQFDQLALEQVTLKMARSSLNVNGKRANVVLGFDLYAEDLKVGHGEKTMLLSGLQPYEPALMDELVADYDQRKQHGQL